ncbi:MAG: hypothetical protein HFH91_12760 [Lachnospiraceae bacterium]|jgi:hypothetical protein|nr:hypothetical protein [Lachnospiraceae bacterium]
MVRRGYVVSNDKGLSVNTPVLTKEQHRALKDIFAETSADIAEEAVPAIETVAGILKNHVPVHPKKLAGDMAFFRLFEDTVSAPVKALYERKYLLPYNGADILPTTYVVLQ